MVGYKDSVLTIINNIGNRNITEYNIFDDVTTRNKNNDIHQGFIKMITS